MRGALATVVRDGGEGEGREGGGHMCARDGSSDDD